MQEDRSAAWIEGMDDDRLRSWATANERYGDLVWSTGDHESFEDLFAPDLVYRSIRRLGSGTTGGRADMLAVMWPLREFLPSRTTDVLATRAPNAYAICCTFTDGAENRMATYGTVRYRGGRAVELTVVNDAAEAIALLEIAPPT